MNRNIPYPAHILLFEPDAEQRTYLSTWLQQQTPQAHVEETATFPSLDTIAANETNVVVFRLSNVDLSQTLGVFKDEYGLPRVPVVILIDRQDAQRAVVISSCLIEVPVFLQADCEHEQDVSAAMQANMQGFFTRTRSRLVAVKPERAIPYALARQDEFQKIRQLVPDILLYQYGYGRENTAHLRLQQNDSPIILWLESNSFVRKRVSDYLAYQGYTVFTVATDQELLDLCQRRRPALILISVDAHGTTGQPATVQRLRVLASSNHLPIIVMNNGASLEKEDGSWKSAGATDYLSKPFGLRELLQKVEASIPAQEKEVGSVGQQRTRDDTRTGDRIFARCPGETGDDASGRQV
jgi:DNA-binding response OmpR family regulator